MILGSFSYNHLESPALFWNVLVVLDSPCFSLCQHLHGKPQHLRIWVGNYFWIKGLVESTFWVTIFGMCSRHVASCQMLEIYRQWEVSPFLRSSQPGGEDKNPDKKEKCLMICFCYPYDITLIKRLMRNALSPRACLGSKHWLYLIVVGGKYLGWFLVNLQAFNWQMCMQTDSPEKVGL